MSQYSDYLLLAGLALCVISVIYAVLQLLRMQPPRGAVITLVLGIVLFFAVAATGPQSFSLQGICDAWGRVTSGQSGNVATQPEDANTGSN